MNVALVANPIVLDSPASPFESVLHHALANAEKIAVICDDQTLSYGTLASRIANVAERLNSYQLSPAARVAVETKDPIEHLIGTLAVMAIGMIAVPLPADSPTSYSAIVADAEPSLILACGDFDVAGVADVLPRAFIGEMAEHGSGNQNLLGRRPSPDEIAMLYYTSGTTAGVSKGVMQSYRQLHITVRYISRIMKLDGSLLEFIAAPPSHAFWYGRVRCVLHSGGAAILNKGPLNPLSVVGAFSRHGCNAISGTSTIIAYLFRRMERRLRVIGSQLRWVKIASQAMAIEDKRRLMEILPGARIVMNYGLTEAMRCCLLPFGDHPDKLESVGQPCDTVEVRIVDATKRPLPPGELGEIQVRGGNLASGYWKKPDMWRLRTIGGWHSTGDLGLLDTDGFVYVKGRLDDAVNVGGRTISPLEVEEALRPALADQDFAVTGIVDPTGLLGEVLCLCIAGEWRHPISWREFRVHLFATIPPNFIPREAVALPELPRTSNGKVQRFKIRMAISAGEATVL